MKCRWSQKGMKKHPRTKPQEKMGRSQQETGEARQLMAAEGRLRKWLKKEQPILPNDTEGQAGRGLDANLVIIADPDEQFQWHGKPDWSA